MINQVPQPEQQISLEHVAEITAFASNVAKFGTLVQQLVATVQQKDERIKQLEDEQAKKP